ncbi:aspartic peptidase [Tanacetum coccineum]
MGDFNVALNIADSHSGSPQMNLAMIEFKDCVYNIEVMDINSTGLHFTWNQKLKDGDEVLKKLDRIMGNIEFIDSFPGTHAIFQPYRISDHSLAVLKIPTLTSTKPKPFKLFNFIMFKSKFLEVVADFWNRNVEGHTMFQVVNKMKSLKKPLRKLVHNHGNLHDRVSKLRAELDEVQKALDLDQNNQILREEEAMYVEAFNIAKLDEERFLKQKAKIEWLDVGDSSSAYFHKAVKSINQISRIEVILNACNMEVSGPSVLDVFISHYEIFLGSNMECEDLNIDGLFQNKVSGTSYLDMVRQVSDEEIKNSMFDIGDDRAPGLDGFTSAFFQKGWDIVRPDVCKAIRDFFTNGRLLKEINHTFISLIPKVHTPFRVNDYRMISCCNVIYKCISKILTNRIIGGIKEVVSENQSAFVPSRRISDNILITQELMHSYPRNRGPPRCAFKVDIQKAYGMVDWNLLGKILKCFGIHPIMIKWIMACVTSTSFSISINGDIDGYFKGKRGLRQEDPLSPYLFTLVMEVLTLILKRKVSLSESFRYHKHCEEL